MPGGDTVIAFAREHGTLYEVHSPDGIRMVHTCWEAICHVCWGWVARSVGAIAAVRAWHARRFGRGREWLHLDGVDLRISSWAVVDGWHVVLFLEDGRRVELDEADNIVHRNTPSPRSRPAPRVPALPPPPTGQLSLFGGSA